MSTAELAEVWQALCGSAELPAPASLSGPRDVLPSVLPVIELGAAAVGASLLAASVLQSVRSGGAVEPVALETVELALALRSERYVRHDGQSLASTFAPLSRFARTADGWIRLHANYPWHRQRLLQVLGTSEDPEAALAAVARWPSQQLEEAIFAAGGCAAVVRTPAEWQAHPQGAVIARLPLLEQTPGGEAAPDTNLAASGPLPASGVRVLDLTRVIAGPVCTRTLGAHGADVLRIDSPELPESENHSVDAVLGKRSALLDLRQQPDRRRFDELLTQAHVLVQGYRPGALAQFGLGADELAARHPGLVVLSLSAWGHTGPWSGRRGFDSLVQAASGIATSEAEGADVPGVLPAQLLDHATGYLGAAAVLLALAERYQHGRGRHIRLSLAQTAAWVLRQPQQPKVPTPAIDPRPFLVNFGNIDVVKPPGRIGGRELEWPGPPARYGTDAAIWRVPAGTAGV
jgi:crotonobetainyl-CoA:carnitine CoA-transferase CaiB-like acyl-CoA transferase